jgi:hypothetical protein
MKKRHPRLRLHRETVVALNAATVSGGITGILSYCDDAVCIPPTEFVTCYTCPETG